MIDRTDVLMFGGLLLMGVAIWASFDWPAMAAYVGGVMVSFGIVSYLAGRGVIR